jgi:hypothetical protein
MKNFNINTLEAISNNQKLEIAGKLFTAKNWGIKTVRHFMNGAYYNISVDMEEAVQSSIKMQHGHVAV